MADNKSKTPLVVSLREERETFLIVESLFVGFRGLGLMLAERKPRPFAMRFFIKILTTDTCGSKEEG